MKNTIATMFCVLTAVVIAWGSTALAADARRPNIILIMADDMGFECVSSNGDTPGYKTPRLDKIAAGGMRFINAHSQPICTPSRVQIMTGIYNSRNYIKFAYMDPKVTTFGNIMKNAGYATCVVGKWQLQGGFDGPNKFGFDEYCLWQLTRRPSRYANPGLEINGKLKDFKDGGYGPDIVSDYLCDFIERHKDKPFFAYYPMMLPHWPFEPTPDGKDWDPKSPGLKGTGKNQYFPEMVTYVDKLVAKITDKLDALKIRENTLVIFTCDNGTYTGITSKFNGKDYPGGKGGTKDNGTHVPLIVSWPGTLKGGQVSAELIDFSDMLPTIAEVGSAKVPAELNVDGRSFASLIRGDKYASQNFIYCWYSRNGARGKEKQLTRNGTFKLYSDGKFYNVIDDFFEKSPLSLGSLSSKQRGTYDLLKIELDKQLIVTAAATEEIKKRTPAKKKKKPKDKNKKKK